MDVPEEDLARVGMVVNADVMDDARCRDVVVNIIFMMNACARPRVKRTRESDGRPIHVVEMVGTR